MTVSLKKKYKNWNIKMQRLLKIKKYWECTDASSNYTINELIKKFKGYEDNNAYLVLLHFEEVVYILNDSSSTLLLCLVGNFLDMWLGVSIITTGDNWLLLRKKHFQLLK